MEIKNIIPKTKARDNFSEIYKEVKDGKIYIVSDRGSQDVMLAPLTILYENKVKTAPPISRTDAFNIFKGREDMKNSVKWEKKIRQKRIYGEYGN